MEYIPSLVQLGTKIVKTNFLNKYKINNQNIYISDCFHQIFIIENENIALIAIISVVQIKSILSIKWLVVQSEIRHNRTLKYSTQKNASFKIGTMCHTNCVSIKCILKTPLQNILKNTNHDYEGGK